MFKLQRTHHSYESAVLLQGYLESLLSTVESLQQGVADLSSSESSLAARLDQAYGESDALKQDAAATAVSDLYKVGAANKLGCQCLHHAVEPAIA